MLLTGELSPLGPRVVDASKSEAPQPVVEQLPVPDPEAQEDAVDLVLRRRLQAGGSNMGRDLDYGSPHASPSLSNTPPAAIEQGLGPNQENNWDGAGISKELVMVSLRWGKGRNHHASPLQQSRKPTQRHKGTCPWSHSRNKT